MWCLLKADIVGGSAADEAGAESSGGIAVALGAKIAVVLRFVV